MEHLLESLPLVEAPVAVGDRVNIVQHPNGDLKQLSFFHNTVVYVGGSTGTRDVVTGRRTHLLDRRDATTSAALAAVDTCAAEGAAVLAVTWPAFGWLAQDGLRAGLVDRHRELTATVDVVVYGLAP